MKTRCFVSAACVTLILGVLASPVLAQGHKVFGKGAPFALEELPAGKLKTQLQALDPQARGKAMQWLHSFTFGELDAMHHLRADAKGGIFYICADHQGRCDGHQHGPVKPGASPISDAAAPVAEEAPVDQGGTTPEVAGAAVPISSPPAYNSKPGATRHIYIDFNGAYVTGKAWSETDGVTTWTTWDCDAWSSDADKTTFSDAEQADIRRIWERLAEDYAPFDVNVTTDVTYDPATYTGDKNKVGWLLVTPTTDKTGARCPHYGAGGVAYVGVYGNANYFSTYQPAWVTPMGVANTAEAASHEMGHNMGLSHDGLVAPATPAEYYGGHAGTAAAPSWGPIMGTGYGRNVSQWSKGEYYGASQLQDDLSIINGRTPYRVDDHGGTFGTATVWLNASISQPGILERTDDNDVFTFTTGAGNISFSANPYKCSTETWGGNSDIVMELYNSSLTLVASSNPANDVTASINYAATAGDYYLVIKPTGCGTPTVASPNGYTVYGSLGQYTVTGTIIPANSIVLTAPNGGEKWVRGSNADVTWASGLGGNVKIELLKAGALFTTLAASTPNDGSFTWAVPADYTVGTNYRVRISSVEQPTKTDESLADFSVTVPPPYYASMNTNPGWTLGTGWAYGVPTGANQDGYGNPDPTAGFNGTSVIGYNLAGDYEASITATRWATTPAINCSTYTGCKLSFYRWLGVEGGYDNAYIQVSNDNTNWTQVWRSSTTNGVNDQDSGWTYCEYDISAVADGRSTVYVRWGMGTTDSSWQWCGWNLDEVKIDGNYTGPTVGVVI
ncbi:MAG TPA: Ser-Thr-rich GPI-anchored membrane family protein, partial [Luteolibacter sp.]|nr:Ser-Thr-rich GPI-anchored membrane family protein [Luteolibacter sp.]